MDARARKLMLVYKISADDAQALVDDGLDSPRKIKAGVDESELPEALKDKVKARK